MEPRFERYSSHLLLSPTPSYFLISPNFVSFDISNIYASSRFCMSTYPLEKCRLWGDDLFSNGRNGNKIRRLGVPVVPVRAAVKWRKEMPFDNVIQRDKKLKLVFKIRKLLVNQPDRIMSLRQLGKFRKDLGLKKKRRFIALLKKFPGVFEIVEEGVYSLQFKLTPEAESLYFEELKIRNQLEDLLVVKLRKLVMMSSEKRILLEKIAHLKTDLGLPVEFRDTICQRYPQFFRIVATGRGPALELTHWDPELAISAAELAEEENRAREIEQQNLIFDRPPKFKRVRLPKGLQLSRGEMRKISHFKDIPYISPYSDFSHLKSGTKEKEKHACAVVHEILSLTVEKRTLVDHLTHFREEFRFSQQVRGMLIRHPDMFYVSLKGDRDSVFLREAYRDSRLMEKNPLLSNKEKMRSLVTVPRFPRPGAVRKDTLLEDEGNEQDASDDDQQEWSNEDDIFTGDDEDDWSDEDDDEDDWSDDDDESPPDFDGENGKVQFNSDRPSSKSREPALEKERSLTPMHPDGRPREIW